MNPGTTVLCADQSSSRLRTIRRTLEAAGYRVRSASDACSAAHQTEHSAFDAILVHESVSRQPDWERLNGSIIHPVIEYGDPVTLPDLFGSCEEDSSFCTWRPEMLLALLTLMLGSGPGLQPTMSRPSTVAA